MSGSRLGVLLAARFVQRWPRAGYGAAGAVDAALNLRDPHRAQWRRRVLFTASRPDGSSDRLPELATLPDLELLRPPAVLASFHMGAYEATGALFGALPRPVIPVVLQPGPERPGADRISVAGGEARRGAAISRAVRALKEGGYVFMMVDGPATAKIDVTLFGRTVPLARGAFAVARMSGAPIVPLATRWRGRRVEVEAGESIATGDEADMAQAMADWLERYLVATPGALEWPITRRLLWFPRAASSISRNRP